MNLLKWVRRRSDGYWVIALILATLLSVPVLVLVVDRYDGFRNWLIGNESGSATIRNIGLLFGGVIAIAFAVWRSRVAERQTAIAQHQAEIARNQAATAERGLLNERYQRGAEMLGSDMLSVRLGGIYALERVAAEHPEEYHVQIMKLFCAVVRNPTLDETIPNDPNAKVREDTQAVMNAIGDRNEHHVDLEERVKYRFDLSGVNLRGAILNLKNLQGGVLTHSDLTNSFWIGANLAGTQLMGTDLSGAIFSAANLSGTVFSIGGAVPALGLTQLQLDAASANPKSPPKLEGVMDAETGRQLVWRGSPLYEGDGGQR